MAQTRPDTSLSLSQAALLTLILWTADVALFFTPEIIAGVKPGWWSSARILLIGVVGTLLTGLVYATVLAVRRWSAPRRYAAVIGAAILCGALLSIVDVLGQEPLRRILAPTAAPPSAQQLLIHSMTNLIGCGWIFGLAGVVFLLIQSNRIVHERERDLAAAHAAALQAQGMATAARLAALRYQLNPHFLFNTLNAISSAVVTHRVDEAETMLTRLADFLRVTLAADPQAMITLEDELETLHAYLAIEGERFRDRLAVEFRCPDALLQAEVPSFLLQPLIENAIKHGVSNTRRRVTLRLDARRDGDDLVVTVDDDGGGAAAPPQASTGVGLENIRQRLETLYGAAGVLHTAARDGGFLASVRLPFTRRDPALAA